MHVFTVMLNEPAAPDFAEAVNEHFPKRKHYKVNDMTYLVQSDELTSDICEKLGLDDKKKNIGVVLRLNSARAGWYDPTIWEWFEAAASS